MASVAAQRRRSSTFGNVRRLPSGRYQASYWHEGLRHVAPATFERKADADAWLATARTDIGRGAWVDPSAGEMSVRELSRRWLDANPTKRSSTRERDEAILRLHVLPAMGSARIASVTKDRVQQLVNGWIESGRAPKTVRRQYDVVRALFAYAVSCDLLTRSPCRGIHLPEVPPLRRRPLSGDDVTAIADAMPEEYAPMVYLGAVLGLRWAEVAGLQLGALDLDAGRLEVRAQLGRDGRLGLPKSQAGQRALAVPRPLVELMTAHAEAQGLRSPDSLVFTSPGGEPLDYTNWRRRVWMPAADKAGLAETSFHDLRRAAATALVRLRVDPKTAQTRLGHSDVRLTLGLYAQAEDEADRAAADRLGERFFKRRSASER